MAKKDLAMKRKATDDSDSEVDVAKKPKMDEEMTSYDAVMMAKTKLKELEAAKKGAKAEPNKAAAKKAEESDDDSDDEPAPKAKAKAKAPAKKAADSDDSDDEPAPKAKAKAKAPAKKAADSDDDSDDEPAPKAKAKAKALAKKAADSDEDDEPAAKAPKKDVNMGDAGGSEEMTVFVGGIPWTSSEDQLRKDFGECGEIEKMNVPMNDEGKPKGIAFITYTSKEGVAAALKFDGEDYGGRTLQVNIAGQKPAKGDKGKGKGDKGKGEKGKGKGKQNEEMTVFVRGLPFGVEEEALKRDFAECGEIERLSLPLNDEGQAKGIAFIQYKEKSGCEAALKFDETDYGGRTVYVRMAGDRPDKGEGKGGKDGAKGKGKDKGKGKGKKGKEGGMSNEQFAAKTGAMVESTGKKQTFADSDDDAAPPAKKAKATAAKDDDSE